MSTLPMARLGRTGLMVTRLGYGAMELRGVGHFPRLSPTQASTLLNAVLDHGINYIDTSPDYGHSEELIGRHLAHRRSEFFLATKCGCPDEPPTTPYEQRKPHAFTRTNIRTVVEKSLARLKTSYLDVLQFHLSPARAVLLMSRYETGWGVRADGRNRMEDARILERDDRGLVTRARFSPREPDLPYRRFVVEGPSGKRAWTNPL